MANNDESMRICWVFNFYNLKTGLLFTHLRELNFYVAFKIK